MWAAGWRGLSRRCGPPPAPTRPVPVTGAGQRAGLTAVRRPRGRASASRPATRSLSEVRGTMGRHRTINRGGAGAPGRWGERMTTTTMAAPAEVHPADRHDVIRVHGARENNLREVSVEIPKRLLTVFTGVSDSGQSSLVFGTIAAESQRMINETYMAFVQWVMPNLARPDVDVVEGLSSAVNVDEEPLVAKHSYTVDSV